MFDPLQYQQGQRQQTQGGFVQVPQAQSSGSPFSSLLGLAGLATSFIPGAQAASPYLTGAAQLASGDYAGAIQSGAGIASGGTQQPSTEGNEGGGEPPKLDDQGNDQSPPEMYTDKKLDDFAQQEQMIMTPYGPIPSAEYYRQLFLNNPALFLQMMRMQGQGATQQYLNNGPGGVIPGQGFSQFGPQGVS